MACCNNPNFKLVEELDYAESVDWDLVQCASCTAYHLRQWSEYAAGKVFHDPITPDEALRFRRSHGTGAQSSTAGLV